MTPHSPRTQDRPQDARSGFFREGPCKDECYRLIRDEERLAPFREDVEALWRRSREFVEEGLPDRACYEFHACFWEMHLAASLLAHVSLVPTKKRKFRSRGPDFQVGNIDAWIEAIVATPGEGENRVLEGVPGVVRSVPDDGIKLRLLNTLASKHGKYKEYIENGVVSPGEPFVVAVNGALVPSARLEQEVPRIVRALYPVGPMAIPVNPRTNEWGEPYYTYMGDVAKASGALVSNRAFLDDDLSGISAVLYSVADALNPGHGLVCVHNKMARNPLPHGFISSGVEYIPMGDEQLRAVRHST